jgi:excisionase family DNA binding protein
MKKERMTLADLVEQKKEALRVEDVAHILDISTKQIYKMAAKGQIPSMKIANCVRFDPHDIATWLRSQSCVISIPAASQLNHTALKRSKGQLLNRVRRVDPHPPSLSTRQGAEVLG